MILYVVLNVQMLLGILIFVLQLLLTVQNGLLLAINSIKKVAYEAQKIEDMKGTFGVIYKAKIDAYNSYYQHMRLLGKVNETLSFDEWEKKNCKWLK